MTNRHVLIPKDDNDKEMPPIRLTFHLRKIDGLGRLTWDPVEVDADAIGSLTKLHPDDSVDVAMLNMSEIFTSRIKEDQRYAQPVFLHSDH